MPTSGFSYPRTIRFHETDAAGVVYFANVLVLCHEAFEASLRAAGINLRQFFGGETAAVPIVHAEADFRRPLYCGDELCIQLWPHPQAPDSFEVTYQLTSHPQPGQTLSSQSTIFATALTRHICIDVATRQRQVLPAAVMDWIALCQG
jgi:1,4-dihydroxy-2-naphthoyl-CoA hydrolase